MNRIWLLVVALATACAAQRIDPHVPGDRCFQLCPDGMVCVGTTYTRARAHPGVCQLARNRCMVTEDCRPRERCVRPGRDAGICHPDGLL